MSENYADVQQSFQRCLTNKQFLFRFYEIFMSSHPDIRPMFTKTDFDKQIGLLRHGLSSALNFAGGTKIGQSVLKRIGETHSRGRMNISPELYPYWINSLVTAVAECDPKFTPDLDKRWRNAMTVATDFIRAAH